MKTLSLEPIHETLAVQTGTVLLKALLATKLNVLMACGGNGICATCHVHVRKGMENLSPKNDRERRTLAIVSGTDATSRLACQCRVEGGGAVVELPKGMYIEKAEDLLHLLGSRPPENVLHPIKGTILVAKGKIITRSSIEELRGLKSEVKSAFDPTSSSINTRAELTTMSEVQLPKPTPVAKPIQPPTPSVGGMPNYLLTTSKVPVPSPPRPATRLPEPPAARLPEPPPITVRQPVIPVPADGKVDDDDVISANSTLPALPTPQPRGLEIGAKLGRCMIVEKLGNGTSGTVYRAIHTGFNLPVAVKVIHGNGGRINPETREQLRKEACLMAQLNHPSVIRVWDFDETAEPPYLVLELAEGLSLSELIQQSGRLTADRATALILQVAEGLQAAWKLGIIHRDVKPANILVNREGKAKLADLGLAMLAPKKTDRVGSSLSDIAEGTIAYMSPEQGEGRMQLDHRTDIYALGATFYHAITGRTPFQGRSWMEVVLKHAREKLTLPHEVAPGVPMKLSLVIEKMMAKSADDRFETYESLIAVLATLTSPIEMTPQEDSRLSGSKQGTGSIWKKVIPSFRKGRPE